MEEDDNAGERTSSCDFGTYKQSTKDNLQRIFEKHCLMMEKSSLMFKDLNSLEQWAVLWHTRARTHQSICCLHIKIRDVDEYSVHNNSGFWRCSIRQQRRLKEAFAKI